MTRSLILIFSFVASLGFAWDKTISAQRSHAPVLDGIWICDYNSITTAGWLTRKDTLQFYPNGTYTWRQGTALESGKWKFMKDGELQLFDRKNTFYEQIYHTRETSILYIPVIGLDGDHLALNFYSDDLSLSRYYTRKQLSTIN